MKQTFQKLIELWSPRELILKNEKYIYNPPYKSHYRNYTNSSWICWKWENKVSFMLALISTKKSNIRMKHVKICVIEKGIIYSNIKIYL